MLREGQRLRLFENRLQKKIFFMKKEEVNGTRRKLHNEQLYNP
jgi:hypothetical protein